MNWALDINIVLNKCSPISLYTTEKRSSGEGVVLIGIVSACEEVYMEAGEKNKDAAFYRTTYLYLLVKAADVDLFYVTFRSLSFKNKIK